MRLPILTRALAWALAPLLVFACSGLDASEDDDDELPPWQGADVDGHVPGGHDGFFAYYTRLDSGEPFERVAYVSEYADVVVNLGADRHIVFWRASSYRPHAWVDGVRTYVEQLFDVEGDGDGLRWDALNRHSHVRIVSQTADEVVVHWRYAPVIDTGDGPLMPGWTGWVDEVYTVRPDGTVRREVLDHDAGRHLTFELALREDGTLETLDEQSRPLTPPAPEVVTTDRLPTGDDRGFGARYTRLGYAGAWDVGPDDEYAPLSNRWVDTWQVGAHPDVVVDFDDDASQWVFWRGLGFVPALVSDNGGWFSNEFNETWGWPQMCEEGGAEPMNDKQARYSHVRIVESSPARVVVHWRYHPTGICYHLIDTEGAPDGWGTTSEFFFTIYPDGTTVSRNTLRSQPQAILEDEYEYHEAMIIHGPGMRPSDTIDIHDTVTVLAMNGAVEVRDGENGGLNGGTDDPILRDEGANITRINLRDTDLDPFTIMRNDGALEVRPYAEGDFDEHYAGYHFVAWDHWPVNLIRAFGRGTEASAYPSHTSLFHMMHNATHARTATSSTRLLLTGLSGMPDAELLELARSWLDAPGLTDVQGATEARYVEAERAWHLRAAGDRVRFVIGASEGSPAVNPAFVVSDWPSSEPVEVRVDGQGVDGVRHGFVRNTQGERTLVVFVPTRATAPLVVEVCAEAC